ncbi:hypothetical protein [Micromonospora sp. 4G55]|uniref:hypothetical protein n=1 Tax=Micromonospora sp. 4G55 TaxID=2806102 RepID=UPI001A53EF3A|nr:hypothetical protein [Micromonospora sp. 4G55]MBM0256410.1 hypothetical protein [Micromonospora sp. 4G55]
MVAEVEAPTAGGRSTYDGKSSNEIRWFGCPQRSCPLPPWQLVYWYFSWWDVARLTQKLLAAMRFRGARSAPGPLPGAVGGDHRLPERVGAPTSSAQNGRGYDAEKKISGRKRLIVTRTLQLDGHCDRRELVGRRQRPDALLDAYMASPIWHVFADQGFAGRLLDSVRSTLRTILELVRRPADKRGFSVLSGRWVVEGTSACSPAADVFAAIARMTRGITRGQPARRRSRRCPLPDPDQP